MKVPNGLAFAEFKGYDTGQNVAVSATEEGTKAILANPVMISAYKAGIPGNGKPFPEGSKIVKIEWVKKKSLESPCFVEIPETLKSISFIEKDSQRFPGAPHIACISRVAMPSGFFCHHADEDSS